MGAGRIHRGERWRIVKLAVLTLSIFLLGSCRSSEWSGTYVGDATLSVMSTGPGASVITTATESGLSLTITEISPGQIDIEIGEAGVIRNCRMRGDTYNQTLGMKSFNDTPNRCEIRVQGETYRVGEGYLPAGGGRQPQDGELTLDLSIVPEVSGTRQFRLEFKGKRRGWLF